MGSAPAWAPSALPVTGSTGRSGELAAGDAWARRMSPDRMGGAPPYSRKVSKR